MTEAKTATEHEAASANWHALDIEAVETELGTSSKGLSGEEARERLERYGPNQLEESKPTPDVVIFLRQFKSPLIYILLVATVVTIILGEYVDSGVIAAAVLLNSVIGFTQERQAEKSVRALMQLVSPKARVLRDGHEPEIDSADLVPGDVVLLESGARVPADIRLIQTTQLMIDESLLTGESVPVAKRPDPVEEKAQVADRTCMAYTGSIVTSGRARGYVVETGTATVIGSIAEHMRTEETVETPMQQRMARFAHIVAAAVGVSVVIAFILGVAVGEAPSEMFMVAVALAVAAVPEGLPVVFTITLALGVRRMAKRNAIIRRLPAVETLGSTTVIGSDKTGTLTQNRMTVQEVWAGGQLYTIAGDDSENSISTLRDNGLADSDEHRPLRLTLLTGVLANEAEAFRGDDGWDIQGDPTEAALLIAAEEAGLNHEQLRDEHKEFGEIPFESERRYSASVRLRNSKHEIFVKGAPERLVEMCGHMLAGEAEKDIDTDSILDAAQDMASRGLRVLAMAYRELPEAPGDRADIPEPDDLIFLGLQGMMDPPREGVGEAIDGCKDAGIRVLMITGDHAVTARAIADQLGIATDDAPVLTGADLEDMPDERLTEQVADVNIYARVSPEHKLRITRALQARDDTVAVTGDGVNDAPALKAANIGIAMGKSGTDVAREASDMVLTDDNFVSIYSAVEEGRVTFDNVRKVTFFLISTGFATVIALLATLAFRWPLLMVPAQLLWLNLVTKGLQDMALAFEPGEKGVLKRPPRARQEGVVSPLLWERTLITGIVMAIGTLFLFRWELDRSDSIEQAQTVALTAMVVYAALHVGNSRSEYLSAFQKNPFSNRFLFIATGGAMLLHIGALYFGPTQFVLRVEPIGLEAWIRIVAVAFSIIAAIELHKLLRRRMNPALKQAPNPG